VDPSGLEFETKFSEHSTQPNANRLRSSSELPFEIGDCCCTNSDCCGFLRPLQREWISQSPLLHALLVYGLIGLCTGYLEERRPSCRLA